jgi:hypothetical protein
MTARNLAGLYDLETLDWPAVTSTLDQGSTPGSGHDGPRRHTFWLTTLDRDGSPHVTGVGALWVDGAFWFKTGTGTRKGRNLARDARCALSLATGPFDLVVEGSAAYWLTARNATAVLTVEPGGATRWTFTDEPDAQAS